LSKFRSCSRQLACLSANKSAKREIAMRRSANVLRRVTPAQPSAIPGMSESIKPAPDQQNHRHGPLAPTPARCAPEYPAFPSGALRAHYGWRTPAPPVGPSYFNAELAEHQARKPRNQHRESHRSRIQRYFRHAAVGSREPRPPQSALRICQSQKTPPYGSAQQP